MECIGSLVDTKKYGRGRVIAFRPEEAIFEIQLPFGFLSCPSSSFIVIEPHQIHNRKKKNDNPMELNVAYEALETMRRHNVTVACHEKGVWCLDVDHCATCLLNRRPQSRTTKSLCDMVEATIAPICKSPPCIACGTPVCRKHSSTLFQGENNNMMMCLDCEALFRMDTWMDVLCSKQHNDNNTSDLWQRLCAVYDRIRLSLSHATSHHETTQHHLTALRNSTLSYHRVGLGARGAGCLAGVLATVAATPLAAPAVWWAASVVVGGSATLTATSSEAYHSLRYAESTVWAQQVIAWHAIAQSLLRVMDCIQQAVGESSSTITTMKESCTIPSTTELLVTPCTNSIHVTSAAVVRTATRCASQWVSAADMSSLALRWTARSSRLVLGGTLAAATVLWEAHGLHATWQAATGSSCTLADRVEVIYEEAQYLPTTADVEHQADACSAALAQRQRVWTQTEVAHLLLEYHAEILEQAQAMASAASITTEDESSTTTCTSLSSSSYSVVITEAPAVDVPTSPSKRRRRRRMSLLERIERHKERASSPIPGER